MKLRSHLILLVLVAVVPLVIFTAVLVRRDLEEQRAILYRGMHDTARALSLGADREIRTSLAVLETLAESPELRSGNWKGFHELCVRTLTARKGAWIVLFDRSGQQLVNSSRPIGSPLPNPVRETRPAAADPRYPLLPVGGGAPVRKVLETGRPVVSDLFVALGSRRPTIGVGIPVTRNGELTYVLEMSVDPEAFLQLLLDQNAPPDSVVSVLDGKGLVIARTVDPSRAVGQPLVPELAAQVATSREGSGVGRTREGTPVYHAFTRSTLTGWTTSIGVAQAVVRSSMNRSIVLLGGGAAVALILGLGGAFLLGKRISAPLSMLAGAAGALARGERTGVPASGVREVADLHGALVSAGEAVRDAAAERERRLVAEAKRAEAQTANEAKDRFLATLSHELRTPINAVYGWVHMLRAGQIPEDARERALDAIMRNARAQIQLSDELLDVSRIVNGTMRLDMRPVDLRSVVEAALDAVRPAASEHGVRLDATLGARAELIVGDPDRLQQVVWNLLWNAIKFTPRGGHVDIRLAHVDSQVEIIVADTGDGISADRLAVIFEPFWQADRGPTRTQTGLGLGLALVRHLVEAHGGTVTAESAGEGKGATFVVRLPAGIASAENRIADRLHQPRGAIVPACIPPALEGLRVLLVDDDPDALDLGAAILTAARADVKVSRSAAEALTIFRDWRPDVLIADIEMPDEGGLSFIRKVRAIQPAEIGKVPALALTAYGRAEDRLRTLAAGFSMHVHKPVDPGELVAVVASLAGREVTRQT